MGFGWVERGLVAVNVKQFGFRSLFRFADGDSFACKELGYLGQGVVHVARDDRVLRAYVDASRFETNIDTMRTIVALGGCVLGWFHVERIVRTGLCAGFASNASPAIKVDNAVFSGKKSCDRADLDARSIGAMVAPHYGKQPTRIRESPLFDVFDPGAVYAYWHLVLGLACDGTRMTADTLSVIDHEAIIHNRTT